MSRICLLYVDTDLVWRGGQDQVLSLMKGMQRRDHQVWLAAPPAAPLSAKARGLGISTVPFRQRLEMSPLAFWRLWHLLGRRRPDIIHFNTPRAMLAGGVASRLRGVPLRVASRRVAFPLRSPLSRFKYNVSQECVVAVSSSIRNTLIEAGVRTDLVQVIYEGVDLAWIDSLETPTLQLPQKGPVIGTVAHLSPEKGLHVLLEAVASLVPRFPQLSLVLVGTGPLLEELRDRTGTLGLQRHVCFTGFRSDSEAVMKHFDLFCLPSLSEGLSSAILVAMAQRLPVVSTSVGGIPELVSHGKTGLLVPPGDGTALAAALESLLGHPEWCHSLGLAGRRRIEERFTLEKKLDETEALYRRLLAGAGIG